MPFLSFLFPIIDVVYFYYTYNTFGTYTNSVKAEIARKEDVEDCIAQFR